MAIILNRVFEAVASERYNKTNLLTYLVLMIAISVIYLTSDITKMPGIAICLISFLIFCIIQSGYYAVTSHNEIYNKPSVFPSINDIFGLFSTGIKYLAGIFALCIIAYIIPSIIGIISIILCVTGAMSHSILTIFLGLILFFAGIVLMFVFTYLYIIPLNIVYLKSFEYSDLFSIKNAVEFRHSRKREYNFYILKAIILGILISIAAAILTVFIGLAVYFAYKENFQNMSLEYIKELIQSTQGVICMIFQAVMFPNLIAQIANEGPKNELEVIKNTQNI